MNSRETDVIVIGAGPVGENVADRTVQGGLETIIIEAELVGGECSYWACDPSKALLRPGHALEAALAVPGAAEAVTGRLDAAAAFARRDVITDGWSDAGQVAWLDSAGIELIRGHGRLSGVREVTVTDAEGEQTVITARHAVAVATGSVAVRPDIPGLAEARAWSSREATSAHEVPDSLAIIGGGVVAAEMATAFASFGSAVTVIARHGLLGGLEPFAGERLVEGLREHGVTVHTDTSTERVDRDEHGVSITTSTGVITAAELLVATGRGPSTQDLGLENIGLEPGAWLDVDDTLRVHGFDWLYGVGDVNHRALLTHQGKYQARAAGDVITARAAGSAVSDEAWGTHVATADHAAVPQVVFTSPEIAAVGLTAREAEQSGLRTRVVDYDLGLLAGSFLHRPGYQGRARAVIDEARRVIVGVTFVGPDVAELVQAATMAVVGEIPLDRLWHAVPAFPTMSEVWLRLLEAYGRP
ncbi:NAD(P)/FAD-dependent oxidoreductase [Microbacterium soli]|uniref:NAD(P)/FAD-dependent oxidoreductase n=1 Tax=Microbacterium soli TaxID=446075 RepID=A0ABP7NC94_9MICO